MSFFVRTCASLAGVALVGLSSAGGGAYADVAAEGKKDGARQVAGEMVFDCLLSPFDSAFRYQGAVTLSAPKDDGSGQVELTGTFPNIPPIAPVAIEDGNMHVTVNGALDGTPFELKGSAPVDVPKNSEVVAPVAKGEVAFSGKVKSVKVESFAFEFDELMDLKITADCQPSRGSDMGAMKSASKDVAAPASDVAAASADAGTQEESGTDAMTLALWGVPVAVALAVVGFIVSSQVRRRA